jgi:hypothetical protein
MNGYAVREQSLGGSLRIRFRELLGALCREELLHVMDGSAADPVDYQYSLVRPISEITLSSLLHVTGGMMCVVSDEKEIYEDYGIAGRKLSVANYMVRHLLSQISIAEIILPEDVKEDVVEDMNENV